MKKRIRYLDYTKGFAMILVMYCHYFLEYSSHIRKFIYLFHLPVFFIVTGMLLKGSNKKIEVKNQMEKLIKPYFIFSFFSLILLLIYNYINKSYSQDFLINNIKNIIMFNGIKATWFLPCVFIGIIGFNYINENIKNKKNLPIILFLLAIIPFINIDFQGTYGYKIIMRAVVAMIYIFIGYYSFDWINKEKFSIKKIILCMIFLIICAYCVDYIDLYYLKLREPIIYYLCGVFGSYVLINFSKLLDKNNIKLRLIKFIGENSLIFLGTHMVIGYFVKYILKLLLHQEVIGNNLHLQGLIILLIVIMLEIPVTLVFNKLIFKRGGFYDKKI